MHLVQAGGKQYLHQLILVEGAVNGHDNTTQLRQPASLLLEHMIYTTTDLNYQLIHCLNYMCIYNYISLFIICLFHVV